MTASRIYSDVFASSEFRSDLDEISTYWPVPMQERPIVYLLALEYLWPKGAQI